MKREFSAGGLVYKNEKGVILWLVRRPKPNQGYRGNLGWSFPKGWIDDREGGLEPGIVASGEKKASDKDLEKAAQKEVREEGGVEAKIVKRLPTIKIFFTDKNGEKVMKFITYFVMERVRDLPEGPGWETEEVKWVDLSGGLELLAFSNERKLLRLAAGYTG